MQLELDTPRRDSQSTTDSRIEAHLSPTLSSAPSLSPSISPSNGAELEEEGIDFDDLDMNDFMDLWFGDEDVGATEYN